MRAGRWAAAPRARKARQRGRRRRWAAAAATHPPVRHQIPHSRACGGSGPEVSRGEACRGADRSPASSAPAVVPPQLLLRLPVPHIHRYTALSGRSAGRNALQARSWPATRLQAAAVHGKASADLCRVAVVFHLANIAPLAVVLALGGRFALARLHRGRHSDTAERLAPWARWQFPHSPSQPPCVVWIRMRAQWGGGMGEVGSRRAVPMAVDAPTAHSGSSRAGWREAPAAPVGSFAWRWAAASQAGKRGNCDNWRLPRLH